MPKIPNNNDFIIISNPFNKNKGGSLICCGKKKDLKDGKFVLSQNRLNVDLSCILPYIIDPSSWIMFPPNEIRSPLISAVEFIFPIPPKVKTSPPIFPTMV